jgi:hypothetical protein
MKRAPYCKRQDVHLTEWLIDDAPGERRAALVEDGQVVEIHLHRDSDVMLGETGKARFASKEKAGRIFITPDGTELMMRGQFTAAEGTSLPYAINREAIGEPGLMKRATARLLDAPEPVVSRDRLWAERLKAVADVEQRPGEFDDAFDIALAGEVLIKDGLISFQRTKAGLVFDIDGVGDALKLNTRAAREIARLLRLYQIGGSVMIDFVASASKADRIAVGDVFDAAAVGDSRAFERTAINGYGLMQVVRPRPRPSVLDLLFGTNLAGLSVETQALRLLRHAVQSVGVGARIITARPAVVTCLEAPSLSDARTMVERKTGARLLIIAESGVAGYGHVHVDPA